MKDEKKYTGLQLFFACFITACISSSAVSLTNLYLDREQNTDISTIGMEFEEQRREYWEEWTEKQSYDIAFNNWGRFTVEFDNKTNTLTTWSGGAGIIIIEIFNDNDIIIWGDEHWYPENDMPNFWVITNITSFVWTSHHFEFEKYPSENFTIKVCQTIDPYPYDHGGHKGTEFEDVCHTIEVKT